MILPVMKLGALALKTLSRPVANRLKKEAGRHPKFRALIISIAQANHRMSTNIQRRLYGHSTKVAVRPLNEDRAVQAAADLFGELFIFLVTASAVVFEVQRNARAEAKKEELRKQEIQAIRQNEQEMVRKLEELEHKVAEVEKLARERKLLGVLGLKPNGEYDPGSGSKPAAAA